MAKDKELTNWKKFQVNEELNDFCHPVISTWWVITEKLVDGKKVAKARLMARGFEEQMAIQADSPIVSEETEGFCCTDIHLFLERPFCWY